MTTTQTDREWQKRGKWRETGGHSLEKSDRKDTSISRNQTYWQTLLDHSLNLRMTSTSNAYWNIRAIWISLCFKSFMNESIQAASLQETWGPTHIKQKKWPRVRCVGASCSVIVQYPEETINRFSYNGHVTFASVFTSPSESRRFICIHNEVNK